MALNTDFIIKMPLLQKLLILAGVVTLTVLAYMFLMDSKLTQEYKRKQLELSGLRSELAKLETVEKDKEKLDRQLKEKERRLEKAKEKLPTETEMEQLLLTISELGQKNGITFKKFTPAGERSGEGGLYTEVPISLNFSGSYLYVMNFFYKVTNLSRIVNFAGLGMSASKGKTIDVNCTAITYKFKEK